MSIDHFVPEIWSARLQRHLDANLVFASLVNRNWEGEIRRQGDTVHIQQIGTPTITNYSKYQSATPEQPRGTTQSLTIDRDKTFYISIDDLDAVQANVNLLDQYANRAGVAMAQTVDGDISARMVAGAGINIGRDDAPVVIGRDDYDSFYRFAVDLRAQLAGNDAPDEGLWMVINPDLEAIALDDDRFLPAGDDRQVTGQIGRIAGFNVLRTTRVPTSRGSGDTPTANAKVLFGAGTYGTTFANQLLAIEAERLQGGRFEDALKGRNVWGCKVIEPETLGCAHVAY